MKFREAQISDIPQIQAVRHSVKENVLSNPALVTDMDCEDYMINRGNAWVCEVDDLIVAFAYADLKQNNIWALFVQPQFAEMGIGKNLHNIMLDWYFSKTKETVWLSTAPGTRAEKFYSMQGWKKTGLHGKETRFEMTSEMWENQKRNGKYVNK